MTEEAAGYATLAERRTVVTGAEGGVAIANYDRAQLAEWALHLGSAGSGPELSYPAALAPSGQVLEDMAARLAALERIVTDLDPRNDPANWTVDVKGAALHYQPPPALEKLAARLATLESTVAAQADRIARLELGRCACTDAERAEWERMKGR